MTHLSMDIKLEGADKLQRKLDKGELLGKPLKHLLSQAAITIQRRAMIFSPVDVGRLKGSWTTQVDTASIPMWSKVGTVVEYAEPLEYSGKSPRGVGRIPFFQPAISESKDDIDKVLKEAGDMIERHWGS